jgi:hypothetical protein
VNNGARTGDDLGLWARFSGGAEITSSATSAVLVTYTLGMFGSRLAEAGPRVPAGWHARGRDVKPGPFGLMILIC